MKTVIGVLMCIAGVALGLYAGLWLAFIGGIVDIINEIKAVDTNAMNIAIGIVKIVFASAIGAFSAMILVIPGAALIND